MGKVQKKAHEKHNLSLSPALTEFIAKTVNLPLSELPHHLASFPWKWPFPRGDLYNWIEPLDRFDEVLKKFNKYYNLNEGLQSKPFSNDVLFQEQPSLTPVRIIELDLPADGDRILVESILSFSKLLLEKCGNRYLYNSTDRLNEILNTTSLPLLNTALQVTLALAQRFAERSQQPQGHIQFHQFELAKLYKLAAQIPRQTSRKSPASPVKTSKGKDRTLQPKFRRAPTTADPNDFRALARPATANAQPDDSAQASLQSQDLDWSSAALVKVSWSDLSMTEQPLPLTQTTTDSPSSPTPIRRNTGNSVATAESRNRPPALNVQSGLREIEYTAENFRSRSIEDILNNVPSSIPESSRYELLYKLRVSYGLLDSAFSRNLLLEIRLTALSIIAQVLGEDELIAKYFEGDTGAAVRQQLVQQLTGLIRDPRQGQASASLAVQGLAMEALNALSRYRHMTPEILSAMGGNSSHGLLSTLVQRGLKDLAQDDDDTDDEIGDDWRHSIFTLWMIFTNNLNPSGTRAVEQFIHKTLLTAFASVLQMTTGKALRIHYYILRFLAHLVHQFRDGLQLLNANGILTIVSDTTGKLAKEALELYNAGQGIPKSWRTPGVDFKIPYPHQFVLRELISLVKDVSKHQGNHADRALRGFVDSSALLQAYRLILQNMDAFGAHTWSEVVVAVCSFLNNEPTSYTVVFEAGIISTLLDTVQGSTEPAEKTSKMTLSDRPSTEKLRLSANYDAISNLAAAFSAICLTEAGLNHFVASDVLSKYFELFESVDHLKAIKERGAPPQLGAEFDQLVRHHPKLKDSVLSCVITMIARVRHICKYKLKEAGLGPKIWRQTSTGLDVDGGVDALIDDDFDNGMDTMTIAPKINLPNGNTLEFQPYSMVKPQLADVPLHDENSNGMTPLDYARPALSFLATFLENSPLCKDLVKTGATDMILDLVVLELFPIAEDSFLDGMFIQDLINVVQLLSNERPQLVLPALINKAKYMCRESLGDFTNFKPDNLQSYFARNLQAGDVTSDMDVDTPASVTGINHTKVLRAMTGMNNLLQILSEIFVPQSFTSRPLHTSLLTQLNFTDILIDLIDDLGKLAAACCREATAILATTPEKWTNASRPASHESHYPRIEAILGLSRGDVQKADEQDIITPDLQEIIEQNKENAAFRNLVTLRLILAELPTSIAATFAKIGSSFNGKPKKIETYNRQKIVDLCNAIARAQVNVLNPEFIETSFICDDAVLGKDTKFKYYGIALIWLKSNFVEEVTGQGVRQSFLVNCFRKHAGMNHLSNIGHTFYEELKSSQYDSSLYAALAANAGLKICLDLLTELTHSELLSSQHSAYLKTNDSRKDFYFSPDQLLLELRMSALPLVREIWESDYAEQASNDIVRDLTKILKHALTGHNEEGSIARVSDYPSLREGERRRFEIDRNVVARLRGLGFEQTLVEEAIFRCNAGSNNINNEHLAEQYCRAAETNPLRLRVTPPKDSFFYKGPANSQKTENNDNVGISSGPSTAIFEDSSQDSDFGESFDAMERDVSLQTPATATTRPDAGQSSEQNNATSTAMSISNLIIPEPNLATNKLKVECYARESIDAEREKIRDSLAERCNNILTSHPNLIFDINDLLIAGSAKLSEESAKAWWELTTGLLVVSLCSHNAQDDLDEAQGKKIAANAHLIGLLCSNDAYKSSMLNVLQGSIDEIVAFLRIPSAQVSAETASPWISPILLIIEKLLALDAEPDRIEFQQPKNLDSYVPPTFVHNDVVQLSTKRLLFDRIMDIIPKVGKDAKMAFAIIRVLIVLTRDRSVAQLQSERRNLQKIFLMIKQLSGNADSRLEGAFLTILRHIIEDDDTTKQIMATEIKYHFQARQGRGSFDLTSYLRELNYLSLRSPSLFVEASNQEIKLVAWSPNSAAATAALTLQDRIPLQSSTADIASTTTELEKDGAAQSVEVTHNSSAKVEKTQDLQPPVVAHPDGIIHFILSEMLTYKDVEDKDVTAEDKPTDGETSDSTIPAVNGEVSNDSEDLADKTDKPKYKAEAHPIYVYRCFLLHCLTELLYSYTKTKVEFISFSRKADPLTATPSKTKSGALNYILTSLVSSGYVEKDDTLVCRKRLVTSDWASKVIVALCSKTSETGLMSSSNSRYSASQRQIEDLGTDSDLAYVRRFVLDHAIKSFKDAMTPNEPLQIRYGRLLCLSELFHKLISHKASTTDPGAPQPAHHSSKRIAKIMLEKNLIAILTSAISDIDLSFKSARKVIKFILRPLKDLTATATYLSINSPDEFPTIVDQAPNDGMSSASSDISEIEEDDDDRADAPDLYRNSALGMLDRAQVSDSDTEDDEDDEDEEMDYDGYEEEMEYEEDVIERLNDGEVVSDEELDELDRGPLEGLPGDMPMEIEYVVDHHHRHHNRDHDDESESDEDGSDGDIEEDIEIEVDGDDEDMDEEIIIEREHIHSDEDGNDGWEDDDQDDDEDDDEDDMVAEAAQGVAPTAHLTDLLRVLGQADDSAVLPAPGNMIAINNAYDHEDEDDDDQEEDGDDMDEHDGQDYDQPFDIMLDGPDIDENEWGWDEPAPVFRRSRNRNTGAPSGFISRSRVIGMPMPMADHHEMMHQMMGGRHVRRAPQARAAEDGQNPLLTRPEPTTPNDPASRISGSFFPGLPRGTGPVMISGDGIAPMPINLNGSHGNILDAIVGAIQRGDNQVMRDGRLQLNLTTTQPIDGLASFLDPPWLPPVTRPNREDLQRAGAFIPMSTISRWQEEARIIFGKGIVTQAQTILIWVYASLIPAAQDEAKKREEDHKRIESERRIAEERAQKEAEEARIKLEEEERLAKQKAEEEEQARQEAEALRQQEGESAAAHDAEDQDAIMEGAEGEPSTTAAATEEEETPRVYTNIRGRQLDITGLDIDQDYLEALPEDLREEVITQQYQQRREQQQAQNEDPGTIDADFLDALPEEMREELLAQEAASQRRRERRQQQQQANVAAGQAAEIEVDDFLATLDPALRRVILAEQPPEILSGLAPHHMAEGRAGARSMFMHHRNPITRQIENIRGRGLVTRDAKRQQLVQLIDKAGVATLLRLMFVYQQGTLRQNLLSILSQIAANRQTRFEVVSLILAILKEGSADINAVGRSLANLSLRARASGPAKTPQQVKRTLSLPPSTGLGDDITPTLVVQQCLSALKHICDDNVHVKSLFLREVDVTSSNKAKNKVKGKGKDSKTTTHPVNDLISLLDRKLIMDNAGCLLSLSSLLATVTSPLASLMKQERERQAKEAKDVIQAEAPAKEEKSADTAIDVAMNDAPEASNDMNKDKSIAAEEAEQDKITEVEKRKAFDPPAITDHNLELITNIFIAPECGNDTFRNTIATLQSLSHIPGASDQFSKELTRHVHDLSETICADLNDLLPALQDAESSTDVQGVAALKFSASASDQVKLLRVLQALDYLAASKKEGDSATEPAKSILTLSYESLGLGPLWTKLGLCLSAVEEKGDTINFANILLPLIESLMVVCKHTTLKDVPIQIKDAVVTSPTSTAYQDNLEELFFQFTSDHRKILNDIVRQSPKLMQGHFAILVKNSKVLDFDNKRHYFSKQINSRHHHQRHPQAPLQLNVRRDQVFIDSYKALYFKNAEEMKYGKLNIRFNGEEGVDAGGVTREWFHILARGMFDPNYALFQPVASDKTTFHPSTLSRVNEEHLMYFKFIGRIIGKALHEGRVLDCHFSRAVYKRILGKKPNLKDLESNDVDYYKSLVWILENDITDILTEEFCVIEDEFGEEKIVDLIPDGRNIAVTEENKKEYVQALVEYRLTVSVKDQLDNFLKGFHDIIPEELISIFNEQELELLISGLPEIDVDDWKANTEYHNYNPSTQQVVWFWRIVKAMTNEERAKLLQFITGTSKVPLNGFKELEGVSGLTKCNIHKDPSTNRLPTSHTCFNQLDLPAYENFEIMKQNLFTAINLGADYFGFA